MLVKVLKFQNFAVRVTALNMFLSTSIDDESFWEVIKSGAQVKMLTIKRGSIGQKHGIRKEGFRHRRGGKLQNSKIKGHE